MRLHHAIFALVTALTALVARCSSHAGLNLRDFSKTVVNQTKCNGKQFTYEQLAGYGFVPSDARDKYGDTLGGYGSSIALDRRSWLKTEDGSYTGVLWAIPDRGWNTQGTLNYQNRIHKFTITLTPNPDATTNTPSEPNLRFHYLDTILLTGPDGTPTTGLDPDATGSITYPGFPILPVATYTGDGFGGIGQGGKRVSVDSEGLVLDRDGGFWVSDEYGPYIYKFSSRGQMLKAIMPPQAYIPHRNGSVSFNANSPPIYNQNKTISPEDPTTGRANNQGLEGLTASADGKTLYALLQSALDQEGGPDNPNRKQARLLEYDISSSIPEYKAEYVVTLPLYTDPTAKPSKALRVAGQSEIHALGNGQFFVLARDSNAGHGASSPLSMYRHADIFDISGSSGATNIQSKANDDVNGSIASTSGDLKQGIKAAEYCIFLDYNVNNQLRRFRLHNGGAQDQYLLNEKWESLALVPVDGKEGKDGEWFLLSLSDNDFITQNGENAHASIKKQWADLDRVYELWPSSVQRFFR
ncbi:MAG: hypothetical protein Q9163_002642 [Psora crenata]